MQKLLILDNYDSFTYNLVHLIESVSDISYEVHRNNKIALDDINRFDKILLSPGPGIPKEAGILLDVIKTYGSTKSILGVCLGLQAISEAYGGELKNLTDVYHGVATHIKVIGQDDLFTNCSDKFMVGRYHSWVVNNHNLPDTLVVTAMDEQNQIMALKHKEYDVRGVQFHPESILSEYGEVILKNWLSEKNKTK